MFTTITKQTYPSNRKGDQMNKFKVVLKQVGGEPFTTEKEWSVREGAKEYILRSLESGVFAFGSLVTLDADGALLKCDEFWLA